MLSHRFMALIAGARQLIENNVCVEWDVGVAVEEMAWRLSYRLQRQSAALAAAASAAALA